MMMMMMMLLLLVWRLHINVQGILSDVYKDNISTSLHHNFLALPAACTAPYFKILGFTVTDSIRIAEHVNNVIKSAHSMSNPALQMFSVRRSLLNCATFLAISSVL